MTALPRGPLLCPSSTCAPGHLLIGVVAPGGLIQLLPSALEVDAEFVAAAHTGRAPEKRFRFASPCQAGGCAQWTGQRCGVIDAVAEVVPTQPGAALPACSIRDRCRWYMQTGEGACQGCAYVVTDLGTTAGHPALS
ncbi:hypothetical protein [Deinococcus multiflagellatus]|uniref:Nitrogen fixation protein n=1 Tax=Deinococcus multiflagellatus TaxID=1656887 RepID=A0ABW1ZK54_9DEIO|nr:hypothetical protein [Deinococcus multiflagellatus]MBZ9712542.1 hypothetical protein [Deinococcus multiflagellatus]